MMTCRMCITLWRNNINSTYIEKPRFWRGFLVVKIFDFYSFITLSVKTPVFEVAFKMYKPLESAFSEMFTAV